MSVRVLTVFVLFLLTPATSWAEVRVTNLTADTANGVLNLTSEPITITLTFSESVTITGAPILALNSGATAVFAGEDQDSGSTHSFYYDVDAGDHSEELDIADSDALSGALIIGDVSQETLINDLPIGTENGSLAKNTNLLVDGQAPSIAINGINTTASGTLTAQDTVTITVNFTDFVKRNGSQQSLSLSNGQSASYQEGDRQSQWSFAYLVREGDQDDNLTVTGIAGGIADLNGNQLTDIDSWTGDVELGIRIDAKPPTLTSITAPKNSYSLNETVPLTLSFDEAMTLDPAPSDDDDLPTFALNNGGTATYVSGSGSDELLFEYVIASDDTYTAALDHDGDLQLPAGMILQDAAGHAFDNTLKAIGGPIEIFNSDNAPPTITYITADDSLPFGITADSGRKLVIDVVFNEDLKAIPVTDETDDADLPVLELLVGGHTRTARYDVAVDDNDTDNILSFSYTVVEGDAATQVSVVPDSMTNPNQVIKDNSDNIADLSLPAAGSGNRLQDRATAVVETVRPTITAFTSNRPDWALKLGNEITITASFSEEVDITGRPKLLLNIGAQSDDNPATFDLGQQQTDTSFDWKYVVGSGDENEKPFLDVTAIELGTATVQDAAGNSLDHATIPQNSEDNALVNFSLGQYGLTVDTVAPSVISVRPQEAGITRKHSGDLVFIEVTFSEPLPEETNTNAKDWKLRLAGENATKDAEYVSGVDTDTITFSITVDDNLSSEAPINYSAVDAFTGYPRDAAGNSFNDLLPALDSSGSLTGDPTNRLFFNETPPEGPATVRAHTSDGTYSVDERILIALTLPEALTLVKADADDPMPTLTLALRDQDGNPIVATMIDKAADDRLGEHGSGTDTWLFAYTVSAGENSSDLAYERNNPL
ncbi:MAG: hypothetical protein ACOCXA_00685, partial [Planctomycetota bacterium]